MQISRQFNIFIYWFNNRNVPRFPGIPSIVLNDVICSPKDKRKEWLSANLGKSVFNFVAITLPVDGPALFLTTGALVTTYGSRIYGTGMFGRIVMSWHGNAFRITGPLWWESISGYLWYLLCCQLQQANGQTIEWLVIWDVTTFKWRHFNGLK